MAKQAPSQQLHDLLVSKNFEPQLLNAQGLPSQDPADTDVFSFDWSASSGKDYGTVVAMLGDDHNLTVFFGDNVGKSMEGDDKKEWFDFLYQLRMFAKRNLLSFSVQDLNKLKYSMQSMAAIKESIFESWTGNKTTSWNAKPTEARLMVKHKKVIGEGDARYRYVESLFIETTEGERFKLPFTKISAGKAMLEHIRQGGRPYDARGQHIATIVNEMSVLARFRKSVTSEMIAEDDTAKLVAEAYTYQANLKKTLESLQSKRGYTKYFESWNPEMITEQDMVIEGIRTLFATESMTHRIEQALPLLAKIHQQGTTMKETGIFEGWINCLAEGTWELPDTPEKQQKLIQLLSKEFPVGPDATNATEQLYNLLGDDELFDRLEELAEKDASADARTIIINRLEQMSSNPAVAQVIGKLKIEQKPQEPVSEDTVCETCHQHTCECAMHEDINTYEIDTTPCPECHEKELTFNQAAHHIHCGNCDAGFEQGKDGKWHKEIAEAEDDKFDFERLIALARSQQPTKKDKEDPLADIKKGDEEHEIHGDRDFVEDEQLDELSPDTLKSYIKKAGSSTDRRSAVNLASRAGYAFGQLDHADGDEDSDDGAADDHKAFLRSKGISRAVDKLEELSNDTVNSYKDKAWDEFAQGKDKRGAGIGRAISKQRGEFGHVKTTDKQLDELSPDTLKSYAKDAALDNARRGNTLGYLRGKPTKSGELEKDIGDKIARRQQGINKAINRLEEDEDDVSPVESAILNRIMRSHTDLLAKYGPQAVMDAVRGEAEFVGDVDEIGSSDVSGWVDHVVWDLEHTRKPVNEGSMKDMLWDLAERMDREQFIDYTTTEMGLDADEMGEFWDAIFGDIAESTDTVEKDAQGKVKSWKHEGDWKKTPKRDGKPVDPRGEVTNMTGRELQKAKSLKEGHSIADYKKKIAAMPDAEVKSLLTVMVGHNRDNPWDQGIIKLLKRELDNRSQEVNEEVDDMTDMTKWMEKFDAYEDKNYHTENLIRLAKLVGTSDDVQEAKLIKADHEHKGEMTPVNIVRRSKLFKKLWPLAQGKEAEWNKRVNDSIGPDGELARESIKETTALTGQYGHPGKMQAVRSEDFGDDFAEELARLKALSLIK